jgi:hypothetical protein
MVLGLVWGASILLLAPAYIWWMVPVLAGLLVSVPLTVLSSRADVGRFVRRRGLLLTPEEVDPPAELAAVEAACAEADRGGPSSGASGAVPISVPAPAPLAMEPSAPIYVTFRSTAQQVVRIATGARTAPPSVSLGAPAQRVNVHRA